MPTSPAAPPLAPLPPAAWDRAKAAHLLNRAGFGGAPAQTDVLARVGLTEAVRGFVLGPTPPAPVPDAPAFAQPTDRIAFREKVRTAALLAAVDGDDPGALAMMVAEEERPGKGEGAEDFEKFATPEVRAAVQRVRQEQRRLQQGRFPELVAWWLGRMATAADPLGEKLTLFWHGHFATSAAKVQDAFLLWRQNQTFREHARGNFGALVKAVSRDPAMIFWLDLQQSRPANPNENFARELMELFTLGEGHYTEADVAEGARAFTGYRIDPRTETFRFDARAHDATPKRFLGRQGAFGGDEVVDVILEQPACPRFLARKLWTFFADENPAPETVEALAAELRLARWELRPVLMKMFSSQEFYAERVMRTQIKSPVQWLVQTARTLEVDLPAPPPVLLGALRQMGQVPFQPPSVKGWDGGKAWISTATLLARYNLAGALLHGRPGAPGSDNAPAASPDPTRVDLGRLAPPELRQDPEALVAALAARLFQVPPAPRQRAAFLDYLKAQPGGRVTDAALLGLLHLMMSTPQFQLC